MREKKQNRARPGCLPSGAGGSAFGASGRFRRHADRRVVAEDRADLVGVERAGRVPGGVAVQAQPPRRREEQTLLARLDAQRPLAEHPVRLGDDARPPAGAERSRDGERPHGVERVEDAADVDDVPSAAHDACHVKKARRAR
jgi:hypothetical protein